MDAGQYSGRFECGALTHNALSRRRRHRPWGKHFLFGSVAERDVVVPIRKVMGEKEQVGKRVHHEMLDLFAVLHEVQLRCQKPCVFSSIAGWEMSGGPEAKEQAQLWRN
eukprot:scaffold104659_cov27-Tisochrysis_lutea.AAC.3